MDANKSNIKLSEKDKNTIIKNENICTDSQGNKGCEKTEEDVKESKE